MDIKFSCKGMWYADEVADLVEDQLGFRPEVSTAEGEVVVHPRPRVLTQCEGDWLREYLEEHPQKSSAERERERKQAEELRRAALAARVQKLSQDYDKIAAADFHDAVRALAELVGVDMKSVKHG